MSSAAKAWLFLTALALTLIGIGHFAWGRQGLLWALVISLGLNSIIYFLGDTRLYMLFHGSPIQGRDPWRVQAITKELAHKARLPLPTVTILPSSSAQALAIGRSWNRGTILLTQGLLDRLSSRELKAVIAFQIAAIKRQDTFIFSIGSFLVWASLTATSFLDTIFRWILGAKKNSHSLQSKLFTSLFAPLISLLLKITTPHANYFLIDSLAASWLESPKDLAQAIWKLDSYSRTIPLSPPTSTSHMFIVSPLHMKNWSRHFVSHPHIEQRIQRLIGYFPI